MAECVDETSRSERHKFSAERTDGWETTPRTTNGGSSSGNNDWSTRLGLRRRTNGGWPTGCSAAANSRPTDVLGKIIAARMSACLVAGASSHSHTPKDRPENRLGRSVGRWLGQSCGPLCMNAAAAHRRRGTTGSAPRNGVTNYCRQREAEQRCNMKGRTSLDWTGSPSSG